MLIERMRKRLAADRASFIEPCLPSPAERATTGSNWIHVIKHDGYRLLMARRDPIGIAAVDYEPGWSAAGFLPFHWRGSVSTWSFQYVAPELFHRLKLASNRYRLCNSARTFILGRLRAGEGRRPRPRPTLHATSVGIHVISGPFCEYARVETNEPTSCCDAGDVVKTKFKVEPRGSLHPQDTWFAWLKGKWVRIPPEKIVPDYAPDGQAYLFMLTIANAYEIVCFVRPKGGL